MRQKYPSSIIYLVMLSLLLLSIFPLSAFCIQKGTAEYDAGDHFNAGLLYEAYNRDYKNAINEYSKAIQLNPKYVSAYVYRGGCYGKLGNYTKDIADQNIAIKIFPESARALYERANAYFAVKKYDNAMADYNKILNMKMGTLKSAGFVDRDWCIVYADLGYLYCRKGKYKDALSQLNQAVDYDPEYAPVYETRANAFYHLKQYDNAWKDVHKFQSFGKDVSRDFLDKLKNDSGREE